LRPRARKRRSAAAAAAAEQKKTACMTDEACQCVIC
jgi:hypothetical protein